MATSPKTSKEVILFMILRLWKNAILIYKKEVRYVCQYSDRKLEISEANYERVWFESKDYTAFELRQD